MQLHELAPKRRVRAFIASVVVSLVSGFVAACSSPGEIERPQGSPSEVGGPVASQSYSEWCKSRSGVTCFGGTDSRPGLVLIHSTAPRSNGLVLWDPGGPGLGLPDPAMTFDLILPRPIRQFDVLLPVEPWVVNPPSSECLKGSYEATINTDACARGDLQTDPGAVQREAIAVSKRLGRKIDGVYLQSFGATRMERLLTVRAGFEPRWAVLESPAPPAGTSAFDLLSARVRAEERLLLSGCSTERCHRLGEHELNEWARHGVAQRSTGLETALGLAAIATTPDENAAYFDRIAQSVTDGALDPDLANELRRVGRLFEQRGPDSVRPSLVALWADLCPAYADWPRVFRSTSPLIRAYAWVYRGCGAWRGTGAGAYLRLTPSMRGPSVLLLAGRADAVVPRALQLRWRHAIANLTVVGIRGHLNDSTRVTRHVRRWIKEQDSGLEG